MRYWLICVGLLSLGLVGCKPKSPTTALNQGSSSVNFSNEQVAEQQKMQKEDAGAEAEESSPDFEWGSSGGDAGDVESFQGEVSPTPEIDQP